MADLQEGELLFSFPPSANPVRFDGPAHPLSHCMKAVDFVVEFARFYLFVEVKDPDDTGATPARRAQFAARLALPQFTRDLSQKYRDTFVYRWAEQRADKPVRYVVLLQLSTLGPADYMTVGRALARDLPTSGTPSSWTRPICDGLAVLNLTTWNALGAFGTVRRV